MSSIVSTILPIDSARAPSELIVSPANLTDEPQAAMPVAAIQAPPPGPGAPPPPAHNGTAYFVKVSAQTDGSFTVTNGRNNFSKTYRAR